MTIELLAITPDAEKLIELAGRTAYQSQDRITDESAAIFIKRLIKMGHTSVIEHASATFKISDVSRAFSHQLVRHRIASYTQKSQRYCKEGGFEFVIPSAINDHPDALRIFYGLMHDADVAYTKLQEIGIKNEDARFVLPNACTTEIVITANFRIWRHIIGLRTDKAAQWEIRNVCMEILKILKAKAPSCFGDL